MVVVIRGVFEGPFHSLPLGFGIFDSLQEGAEWLKNLYVIPKSLLISHQNRQICLLCKLLWNEILNFDWQSTWFLQEKGTNLQYKYALGCHLYLFTRSLDLTLKWVVLTHKILLILYPNPILCNQPLQPWHFYSSTDHSPLDILSYQALTYLQWENDKVHNNFYVAYEALLKPSEGKLFQKLHYFFEITLLLTALWERC